MLDFQDTNSPKRRAADCEMCRQVLKAFVLNDIGEPDFDGHRKAHTHMIESEKILKEYKTEATKKVIGWVVAVLLGAVGSSVIAWVQGRIT